MHYRAATHADVAIGENRRRCWTVDHSGINSVAVVENRPESAGPVRTEEKAPGGNPSDFWKPVLLTVLVAQV